MAVSPDAQWIVTGTSLDLGDAAQRGPDALAAAQFAAPQVALWKLDASGTSAERVTPANQAFGTGHRGAVTVVAISPDARWVYSGDETGLGKIWNTDTGDQHATMSLHTRAINDAIFTPDGQRLLTASNDGTVTQWDLLTGNEIPGVLSHVNPQHSDAYDAPVKAAALAPDGKQLVTLSEDAQHGILFSVLQVWDIDQAQVVAELYRGPQTITSVAVSDNGRSVLAAGSEVIVGAGGAETEPQFRAPLGFGYPRGNNLARRRSVSRFRSSPGRRLVGDRSAPGAGVLTVGGNGALLWDPTNIDRPLLSFKPHSGVTTVDFSPDGESIVTGSTDRRVKIWNADSGQGELQLPPEHSQPITSARFSPVDRQLLVTASHDGTARIWRLGEQRVLHVLDHSEPARRPGPFAPLFFRPMAVRYSRPATTGRCDCGTPPPAPPSPRSTSVPRSSASPTRPTGTRSLPAATTAGQSSSTRPPANHWCAILGTPRRSTPWRFHPTDAVH